jgi:hypothetical protein
VSLFDDDPSPRWMKPSGSLDELPDGAHVHDLHAISPWERPSTPEMRTPGQKKRYARDLAILAGRQNGMSIRKLASSFDLDPKAIRNILKGLRQRAGIEA